MVGAKTASSTFCDLLSFKISRLRVGARCVKLQRMSEDILHASVERLHETFDRTDLDVEWRKIQSKIEEARYNPGDIRPLVDCIFSLMLAARSRGYSVDAVMRDLRALAEANLHRRWKKMPDGTYQAVGDE
jgi:hypothetical protein